MHRDKYRAACALIEHLIISGDVSTGWRVYLDLVVNLYPQVDWDRIDFVNIPQWFPRMASDRSASNRWLFRACWGRIWREISRHIRENPRDDVHHKRERPGQISYFYDNPVEYYAPHPDDLESISREEHNKRHREMMGYLRIRRAS